MEKSPPNLAVLFADVSGSTQLYEKLGDARALQCMGLCLNIMRDSTVEHGGRVIKTIGDAVLCVFPTASAAANAAVDMQGRVTLQDAVDGQRLAICIGIQYGPVIEQANDVFGDSVNVAARMASLANSGQIITTRVFVDAMSSSQKVITRSLDTLSIKGKQDDVAVYEIIWQQSADLTILETRHSASDGSLPLRLRLRHHGREIILGPDQKQVTLGRDASSDMVITDKKASRHHVRIERRRDKYVLIDQSSNGTYVTIHGQPEIGLRREEVVLQGRGSISFGHAYRADPAEIVAFEVEG